jgi:2,5-diamino-6-(ribosylamino)-4(3H)-pyrimidinone 5'-phosphate reductase
MPIEKLLDLTNPTWPPDQLYVDPGFPDPPKDLPYIYLNMVATADGKTLLGPRGSTAKGLGSTTDQMLMRRLEDSADGLIIGANTLRASHVIYPARLVRAVVKRSGELPLDNRFFTDSPERAVVFAPRNLPKETADLLQQKVQLRQVGEEDIDVREAARVLRSEFGVKYLLLEGGAGLNFDFFAAGIIDEFFLTFAPKIKGGGDRPTVVDGPGLPDTEHVQMGLISVYRDSDELFLRYEVSQRIISPS